MNTVMIVCKNSILGHFRNDVNWRHSLRAGYIRATRFDPRCVLFYVLKIVTWIQDVNNRGWTALLLEVFIRHRWVVRVVSLKCQEDR